MCVIICITDGKYPSKKTLKSAEDMNSHGGSIAWLNKDGTKSYKKGIKASKIHKIINNQLIPKQIKTAIIHFRIASVGGVKRELNHPFEISSKVELNMENMNTTKDLLFHNGTWEEYTEALVEYLKKSKNPQTIPRGAYSDSRIMAYLAHKMGVSKMAKKVTGWNKVAILTSKGIVKYGAGWCDVKGNLCSNDYFLPAKTNFFGVKTSTFKSSGKNPDYVGYLTEDEKIEMAYIIDHYGVTEDEIGEMLEDGSSIYDLSTRLDMQDDMLLHSLDMEDEINYYNMGRVTK